MNTEKAMQILRREFIKKTNTDIAMIFKRVDVLAAANLVLVARVIELEKEAALVKLMAEQTPPESN